VVWIVVFPCNDLHDFVWKNAAFNSRVEMNMAKVYLPNVDTF